MGLNRSANLWGCFSPLKASHASLLTPCFAVTACRVIFFTAGDAKTLMNYPSLTCHSLLRRGSRGVVNQASEDSKVVLAQVPMAAHPQF